MSKSNRNRGWAFISNMYPSVESPAYGAFVQRSYEDLKNNLFEIRGMYVIAGRKSGYQKAIAYIKHLFRICEIFFRSDIDNIYLHYASHHCLPVAFAAKYLKKNVVVNVHGDDLVITDTPRRKFMMLGQATIFRKAKLIVVPSLYFKEIFLSRFPDITKEKIFVSPSSGIMAAQLGRAGAQRDTFWQANLVPTTMIAEFGYVGRIEADKGWELLVDVMIELSRCGVPDIRLSLWGDGAEVLLLQEKIAGAPKGLIRYLGAVAPADVVNLHREFDFHVVPSYRESLGLSALEGMAAGHVVICAEIRPFVDFAINGENVLFFSAGDAISLKGVLLRVLGCSREHLQDISNNAVRLASKFDRNKVSQDLANAIREVIDERN